ncbi:hypothetical protein RHS04_04120 [Rhizoctonia solani]|uniref:Aminoglycoside phosphotransferase domain-containing protein n=1 Tax=Rhizoctonia solani TaxID=456999 RepID=A0A8H7H7Y6_9AGAM|nr:hypothetical protein RHS04_04120 [Rhizoctonia solani]
MAVAAVPLIDNFTSVFTAFDPYHEYFITPLSGGLVNFTVRVNISDPTEEHECLFGSARSVVAKYAPAYVASIGESAPFSQYRQASILPTFKSSTGTYDTARALALLSRPSVSAYIESSNVTFPKLVYHNPDTNILVMSDLGNAKTLDKWLVSGPDVEAAAKVGAKFGEFLARLDVSLNLFEHFDNPSIHELIFGYAIAPIESHLLKCGYDPSDAAFVGKLCIAMHERQQVRLKRFEGAVFGIGDSWPRSFLVDGTSYDIKPSVVDWEFAGMISPLIDLAQLCAHLYLLCQTSSPEVKSRVKKYTLAMVRAHHNQAPEWHYKAEYRADAWLLFGREIIVNTIEMEWWGGDEVRKQADMKMLGGQGAAFVTDAKRRGNQVGALFEDVFDTLC